MAPTLRSPYCRRFPEGDLMPPEQGPEQRAETNPQAAGPASQDAILDRLESEIAEVEAELSSLEE